MSAIASDPAAEPPLAGWVVADLSTGIAGAYCTKILADGGADVLKVESPSGDALRAWSASGAAMADGTDGALFSFLSSSKRSIVADPLSDLASVHDVLDRSDVAVWSRGSAIAEHDAFAPDRIRRDHPHLTVVSITPFGLEGPWSDRPATEFTLQAWCGGIMGLGRGDPDRAPVFVAGQVGEWLTGTFAATGAMASRRRGGDDNGELLDVSMLEVNALCLAFYPVTHLDVVGKPFREERMIATPGVGAAKDGMVAVGVGTGQQWLDFCAMAGHPEWVEVGVSFTERKKLAKPIAAWFAEHTVEEIREMASVFRLPNALICNGATMPTSDHFEERGTFVPNPRDGFLEPGPPYRMEPARLRSPQPAPRLGQHTADGDLPRRTDREPAAVAGGLPFSDLRVLDLTAFWAGPSCTHVLAQLGAEVVHVESPGRLDGARMVGVTMTDEQWWERSPIFSGVNTDKKSLTLDLSSERGRELLRRLVGTADVIVENYTPRVLEQLGLTFETAREIKPDVVLVRMPGFGLDGPWRDNAAFAYTIEDAGGLTWLTGYPDAKPVEPYCVGDPNAGLHALAALLLALEHRQATGEGVFIEAAMVDAAVNVSAEQTIEYSAYGHLLERDGNRGPTAAPQNLYHTADPDEWGGSDSWVAVAVATDAQWEALVGALGRPDWALDPALATFAGRVERHDVIDEHLSTWCGARGGDEIVETLWPAGVPVAKVMQPHRQDELPQLEARRFFERLEHPVFGSARYCTLPIRFSAGPDRYHRRHAPLLGEHNHELLGGIGLSDDEISVLESDGVIGRVPVY